MVTTRRKLSNDSSSHRPSMASVAAHTTSPPPRAAKQVINPKMLEFIAQMQEVVPHSSEANDLVNPGTISKYI